MKEIEHEYEIVTQEGEWCAAYNSLEDARHYAMVYSQDSPVYIVWVRKMIVEEYPLLSLPLPQLKTEEGNAR